MRGIILAITTMALLAGCALTTPPQPRQAPQPIVIAPTPTPAPPRNGAEAARTFLQVVREVEPVAEAFCRQQRPDLICDFQIVIDDRPGQPPNAFHTLDPTTGRPLIGFTVALIADARNADELAFVLGHEAGHHIAGHLGRSRNDAVTGAVLLGTLAALGGADASVVETAQNIGANVGARRYSKSYELEADVVGTLITLRAGYDPERGAAFFGRIPDPGDRFLGSHPANAQRQEIVRETARRARAGF